MNKKSYTYGNLNRLWQFLAVLISLLCFIAGLFFLVGFVSLLIKPEQNVSVLEFLGNFIGLSVWSPLVFLFLAYLYNDVSTDDPGLHINFLFKTYLVKWGDVADIRPARVFGLPMLKKSTVIVLKQGLTPFHRLYGLVYAGTSQPSLSISSYLHGYADLKDEIHRQSQKGRSSKR